MAPPALRVLILEDDTWLRESLSHILSWPNSGLGLAGAFGRVKDVLRAVEEGLEYDIGLIDLGLPDGSGVEAIATLAEKRPEAPLLAFTIFEDAPNVFGALRAGARGYVLKSTTPDRLIAALHEARSGGAPLSAPVARLVVDSLVDARRETPLGADLSQRERDVLILLSKGLGYSEIGEMLDLKLGTVQGYIKNIYRKLSVSTKAEAATVAAKLGLV